MFDSSTGFTLPDRSVFSPDASWISLGNWNALTEEDKNKFAPICPEFIIEVRSKFDSVQDLKNKMVKWIANGATLAWLIDPIEEITYIFRSDGSMETVLGLDNKLTGEDPVKGFELDLSRLK